MPLPTSVLFVCHGNICRSPMAEFVMKHLLQQEGLSDLVEVDSAATSAEELGNGVHHGTQRVLAQHGVPCGKHRSRQVTARDLQRFDHVVCMDQRNLSNMRRMFGEQNLGNVSLLMEWVGEPRDVADPWYTGDFDTTYADVLAGCEALLSELAE